MLMLVVAMGLASVETGRASDVSGSDDAVMTDDEASPESDLYLEEDNAEESYYSDEESLDDEGGDIDAVEENVDAEEATDTDEQ